MKVLFISNLFPDASEPNRGIYNARLVHALARHCELRVISPRPALPLMGGKSLVPRSEDLAFKPVFPTARYVPKVGSAVNHRLMASCLRGAVRWMRDGFPFDACLVSWAYPDAVAVSHLAQEWGVPFIAVAQGSDVHQYLKMSVRRRLIVEAFERAGAVITRSRELGRLLADAGLKQEPHVIYNGVDTAVFRPASRDEARRELKLPLAEKTVLYVGNLVPIKNPMLLLEAMTRVFADMPDARLIFVGDGPLRADLEHYSQGKGVASRVHFAGRQPEANVARYMQAADVLCVPSDNEGVPNVLLEGFACGLPAVATRVGGIPEVLSERHLGLLVEREQPQQLADALREILVQPPASEPIVNHARTFAWETTASRYMALLERVAEGRTNAAKTI